MECVRQNTKPKGKVFSVLYFFIALTIKVLP
jgi:hypothetical protein